MNSVGPGLLPPNFPNNVGNPAAISVHHPIQYPNTAQFQGTSNYDFGFQSPNAQGLNATNHETVASLVASGSDAHQGTYQGYGHVHELSSSDPQYERRIPMRKEKPISKSPAIIYCETCKVSCPGEQNYQAHCDGQKHRKRLAAAALQESNGTSSNSVIAKATMRCTICNVNCSGNDSYQAHLRGKQHAKTVRLYLSKGLSLPESCNTASSDFKNPTNTTESVSVVGTLNTTFVNRGVLTSLNTTVATCSEENSTTTDPIEAATASNAQTVKEPNQFATNMIDQTHSVLQQLPDEVHTDLAESELMGHAGPDASASNVFAHQATKSFSNMDCIEFVSSDGKVQVFRCNLCDCKLLEGVKASHLVGKRHQQALKRKMEEAKEESKMNSTSVHTLEQTPIQTPISTSVQNFATSPVQALSPAHMQTILHTPAQTLIPTSGQTSVSSPIQSPLIPEEQLIQRTIAPFLYFKNGDGLYMKYLPVSSEFPPIGSPNVSVGDESFICVGRQDVVSIHSMGGDNPQSESLMIKPSDSTTPFLMVNKPGPSLGQLFLPRLHQFRPMLISPQMLDSQRSHSPNLEDRHIIKKHAEILPKSTDIKMIYETTAKVERLIRESAEEIMFELDTKEYVDLKEDTDISQNATGYERVFIALNRVGLLAKNLLLKGDHTVEIVMVCKFKPTLHFLDLLSKKVFDKLNRNEKFSFTIQKERETSSFTVSHHFSAVKVCITLTCLLVRDLQAANGPAELLDDPDQMLDKTSCLNALSAIRRANWYQTHLHPLYPCAMIVRIFKFLSANCLEWKKIDVWAIELLCERIISGCLVQLPPGKMLEYVLDNIATGLFTQDMYLLDPCEDYPIDVNAQLTEDDRSRIIAKAKECLELIKQGRIHEILSMEPIKKTHEQVEDAESDAGQIMTQKPRLE